MFYPTTLYRADPFALMRRLADEADRARPAGGPAFPAINIWQNDEAASRSRTTC